MIENPGFSRRVSLFPTGLVTSTLTPFDSLGSIEGEPPVLVTIALSGAVAGVSYYATVEATGATHWELTVGTLPSGLSLDEDTGIISGTALTGDLTSNFTISISNAYGAVDAELAIQVTWTYTSYMQSLVTAGKVPLWWDFTEASGDLTNRGSGGTNLRGLVSGSVTRSQTGQLGINQAIENVSPFNGYYEAASGAAVAGLTTFTVGMLIKFPASDLNMRLAAMTNKLFIAPGGDTRITATIFNSTGTGFSTTFPIPSLTYSTWRWFFFTFDLAGDKKIRVYYSVSGTISQPTYNAQPALTGAALATSTVFRFGRGQSAGNDFRGPFDEGFVCNAVLTTAEMQKIQDLTFGAGTAESYSLSGLTIDDGFSYSNLSTDAKVNYDNMWAAINDADEYPAPDTIADFSNYSYNPSIPETSYNYEIGYGLRYVLFAYYFAFARTGEKALFDEIRRIMAIVTPGDLEDLSVLFESMLDCTIALHMLFLYANRNHATDGATYTSEFNTWYAALLARLALRSNSIVYSSLAHSFMSAIFTSVCLYLVTGNSSYLAQARDMRLTFQGEINDLSHDGRALWYHRMPRTASPNNHDPQPSNYADYTIECMLMLYEVGFNWYHDLSGFDMSDLVNALLNMTTGETTCAGDIDGGSGTIAADLWAIRTFAAVAKHDSSGVLATRAAAITALSTYPLRRPATHASLLFSNYDIANTAVPTWDNSTAAIGTSKTITAGTWANSPTPTVTRVVQRSANGTDWTTSQTVTTSYTPVDADWGHVLRIMETATNGVRTAYSYSSSTNVAYEVPAQTIGSELLADSTMEAAGTSSWTASNSTLSKQTGDPYAGTQCLRVVRNGGGALARQAVLTSGSYYLYSGAMRGDGTNSAVVQLGATVLGAATSSTSWQFITAIGRSTSSNADLYSTGSSGTGNYSEYDSQSIKLITRNTQLTALSTNMRITQYYTLPASPISGDQVWVYSRISDFTVGNYWVTLLQYNGSQWNISIHSAATFTLTLQTNAANIGDTNGLRINMNGNSITLETTANGGTDWTQRGSTVTSSLYNTATGVNAIWTAGFTMGNMIHEAAV